MMKSLLPRLKNPAQRVEHDTFMQDTTMLLGEHDCRESELKKINHPPPSPLSPPFFLVVRHDPASCPMSSASTSDLASTKDKVVHSDGSPPSNSYCRLSASKSNSMEFQRMTTVSGATVAFHASHKVVAMRIDAKASRPGYASRRRRSRFAAACVQLVYSIPNLEPVSIVH
jgi:hypothetical protein